MCIRDSCHIQKRWWRHVFTITDKVTPMRLACKKRYKAHTKILQALCGVSLCKFYGREHKPAVAVDTGNQTSASIQGTPTLTCQGTSTPLYSSIENSGGSHGRPARRCRVRVVDIDDAPASADVLRTCPPLLALCQCIHHCWCYSFYCYFLLFSHLLYLPSMICTVGCVAGRPFGLWKLSGEVLAWLSVWSEVQMICRWFSWCHCYPIISCSSKIQNGLPFWCRLTQVVLEKRP